MVALLPLVLCGSLLAADDGLPRPLMARFVVALARLANTGKHVACHEAVMSRELKNLGMTLDDAAPLAFASSEAEVRSLAAARKVVVTPSLDLLVKGGAIAIVQEDGKPSIYLHLRHLDETGVKFSTRLSEFANTITKPEGLKK
jgi:hypothetical protein